MLKISDFSKLTHVSVRMLRYYDTLNLLKPALIDNENGYRMYSAEQVPELQKIIMLRDSGFGIQEIEELMCHWEKENLTKQFKSKITEIKKTIYESRRQIEMLKAGIDHINNNKLEQYYNITIKAVPDYPVVSLRRKVSSYWDEGDLWHELTEYIQKKHIEIDRSARNSIAVYHDDEFLDSGVDIEVCMIVRKSFKPDCGFNYRVLKGEGDMACTMVYGPYSNIASAYESFTTWFAKNEHFMMKSPTRQITIIDMNDTDNPEEFLTEIQIPLVDRTVDTTLST